MNTIKILKLSTFLVLMLFTNLLTGCNGDKFQKESMDKFEGTWELQGRSMFDGIRIEIGENKNGDFKGGIISLNDNKFVQLFSEPNDVWVSRITRISNYEFKLVEKKIGGALFSVYGLDTSKEFKVQFIDENTIGLSAGTSDPKSSSVRYVRVK